MHLGLGSVVSSFLDSENLNLEDVGCKLGSFCGGLDDLRVLGLGVLYDSGFRV